MRLTALLAPQLASGAKIVLITSGVAVAILHPGFVQTPMTGGRGDVDAATAARNLLARIDELTPATSGRFMNANGSPLPW